MTSNGLAAILLSTLLVGATEGQDLELGAPFSDNAILQQQMKVTGFE